MAKTLNDILLLEPGGEIRIGDGAPGVNFTGLRIYKTTSGYGFETYKDDERVLWINEEGLLEQPDDTVAGQDLLNSDNSWQGVNRFLRTLILGESAALRSDTLDASMIGSGLGLFKDEDGKWQLWVDKLFARQSLTVMELLFMQKRVFNGSLIVARSGTGKPSRMEAVPLA